MNMTLARQRGASLLVGLIMLLLMTLMAITAFRLSTGNLQIVGNMQQRSQTLSAAQGAIENTVSNTAFTNNPGVPTTTSVSINGGATNDISVVTTPTCITTQVIPPSSLDPNVADDAGCLIGKPQMFGVDGVSTSNVSMCANSTWDIQSVATDTSTNAQAVVNEGVSVRVSSTTTCP